MNEQVTRLFQDTQPGPTADEITTSYVATARAIAAICAVRILLLITVLTGAAIWCYTIFDPTHDRMYAAVAFSVVFVLPMVGLYWKRA